MTAKLSKADQKTLQEANSALRALRSTYLAGSNRFGEYGRNVREAYDRWRDTVERLTGVRPEGINH